MSKTKNRILAICNDADTLNVLRLSTEHSDFIVHEACDAEIGLKALASPSTPILVIVDLALNDCSGPDLCRQILDLHAPERTLPVLGIVCKSRMDLIEQALNSGIDDFLCHPLTPQLVLARITARVRGLMLRNQLAEQASDLEFILEITRRLSATLKADDILLEIVTRVSNKLGIDRCSLVLADEEFQRGVVIAASDDRSLNNLEIDLRDYPEFQEALHTGKALVVTDTSKDPIVSSVRHLLQEKGVNSLAVLPLRHHEERKGVMFLRSCYEGEVFTGRVIRLSRTIAHSIAVALRNEELLERTRLQSMRATEEKTQAQREAASLRQFGMELRKTTNLLENLIDSSASAIIAADMKGKVLVWNKAAERIIGYSREEAIETIDVTQFYYEDARSIMASLRADDPAGQGKLQEYPIHVVSKSGERIPVSLSAAILYEEGKEIASVGILTDLRDRILIEEKLCRAQSKLMRTEQQMMIAELAGSAAHELNQPLTSVMGYAELLKRTTPPNDPNQRAIDIIFRESDRMAEIVRKIGRITRYETKDYVGKTRIVDLDRSSENND